MRGGRIVCRLPASTFGHDRASLGVELRQSAASLLRYASSILRTVRLAFRISF
jgi:hypothetical protein